MGPWMGGWMAWWIVIGILFIALVVAAIVYLLLGTRGGESRPQPDALAVLRERYARGEIDRPDFEERLALLQGKAPPQRPPV